MTPEIDIEIDNIKKARPGVESGVRQMYSQNTIEDEPMGTDSVSKEALGAIFRSIKAIFKHPLNLCAELLFLFICILAFYFVPDLHKDYGEAPKNIIIVTIFIMIVTIAIRLVYVKKREIKHPIIYGLLAAVIFAVFLWLEFLPELKIAFSCIKCLFS